MNSTRNSPDNDSMSKGINGPTADGEQNDDSFGPEDNALLNDIQTTWDNLGSSIDKLLDENPPEIAFSEPPRHVMTCRSRLLVAYAILLPMTLFSAIYWGCLIHSLAFNTVSLISSMAVEGLLLLLFTESLQGFITILTSDPTRKLILRMPDFSLSLFHARKVAVASMAALFALTVVSFTTTGIDGYTITQNHHARAAAMQSVTNTLTALCTPKIS